MQTKSEFQRNCKSLKHVQPTHRDTYIQITFVFVTFGKIR